MKIRLLLVSSDPVLRGALKELFADKKDFVLRCDPKPKKTSDIVLTEDPPPRDLEASNLVILGKHIAKPFRFIDFLAHLYARAHPPDLSFLTAREAALYTFLRAHSPVSRKVLLQEVWGYDQDVQTHTLETHIHALRKKLKKIFPQKNLITRTKQGYVWRGPVNRLTRL